MRTLCVFCGSASGNARYADVAKAMGEAIAARGFGLVYGGAKVGLMGLVADAARSGGAATIGVIPGFLAGKEIAHEGLTELHRVETMHQRKALMSDLSDGFAALPGGFGTADELFEILTWAQLGIHARPVGLLNTAGFFDPLLAWLDHAVAEGFLRAAHREMIVVEERPGDLLGRLLRHRPAPATEKWIGREDR
jgi:uncharacterized protein (TIGR00730 family)